jgi:Ca2+-transporting ATPase
MNLSADESLLTGESVPVRKHPADKGPEAELTAPGGDDTPSCFSGSMIVSGKGVGLIKQTGVRTRLGQIGKSLESLKEEKTPLERETNKLVLVMAIVGVCAALGLFLAIGLTGMNKKAWLDGALAAISLAMGLLPEEFPVILTVFLSLGAWRISRSRVLTRRNSAIETLGACTVLCTDKTGTLTINQMMVQALWDHPTNHTFQFRDPADTTERVDEQCHSIVEFAVLSSQRDPFDPMEQALKRLLDNRCVDADHSHGEWHMLKEYPLTKEMLAMSRVYSTTLEKREELVVAVKGAPETVGDLCHLDQGTLEMMRAKVNEFAGRGLRVLGVARALHVVKPSEVGAVTAVVSTTVPMEALPSIQHDFAFEFIGLVGFIDPIRPSVPGSIKIAYEAGMKVVMITGDYPGTAKAIAEKIGLEPRDQIITGPELDSLNDEDLAKRINAVTIFARVVPEQKLRIVKAFKAAKHIVAMTGDGVNDAPALKAAHIGIAMGMRGTDVAREAAHLVLLDDDFSSIVRAVRLGRRIYDNLRKAMSYVISIHMPLAGMVLLPVLFHLGERHSIVSSSSATHEAVEGETMWSNPIFHAVHIVFLEMVIDPACSVILEAEEEEKGVMQRPPRDTKKGAVSPATAFVAGLQGLVILTCGLLLYYYSRVLTGANYSQASALAFAAIIVANLGLIIEDRSWDDNLLVTLFRRKNTAMYVVVAIAFPALFLVIYVPGLNSLFGFSHVPGIYIPVFIGVGIVSSVWFEFYKLLRWAVLSQSKKRRQERAQKQEFGVATSAPAPQTVQLSDLSVPSAK